MLVWSKHTEYKLCTWAKQIVESVSLLPPELVKVLTVFCDCDKIPKTLKLNGKGVVWVPLRQFQTTVTWPIVFGPTVWQPMVMVAFGGRWCTPSLVEVRWWEQERKGPESQYRLWKEQAQWPNFIPLSLTPWISTPPNDAMGYGSSLWHIGLRVSFQIQASLPSCATNIMWDSCSGIKPSHPGRDANWPHLQSSLYPQSISQKCGCRDSHFICNPWQHGSTGCQMQVTTAGYSWERNSSTVAS